MTEVKNILKEKKDKEKDPSRQFRAARKFLDVLSPETYLTQEKISQWLPFVFFLALLAVVYIGNSYYAEKTVRDTDRIINELKELRSEYISTKSELMFISKQSEVAKAVQPMQIKESVVPPRIIHSIAYSEKK